MPKRRGDWCGNGGPLPNVRACKQARVRRLEASSVLSEICRERWPPESQIDHRRAREVSQRRAASRCFTRRAPRSSSTVLHWVWQSGSCTRTLHCRNNQSAIRALCSAIKTAAATGCASKPADQTKSSQIKRSKTSWAYPKYVDGAALELTYLSSRTFQRLKQERKKGHCSAH